MSDYINPAIAEGVTKRVLVDSDGDVINLHTTSRHRIDTALHQCHCRLGEVSSDPKNVITFDDGKLTHGAITDHGTGDPAVFTPGNYLRGLTSGAIGKIMQLMSATVARVALIDGSVPFQVEHVHETTTGLAGGDTGSQADVSAVDDYSQGADAVLQIGVNHVYTQREGESAYLVVRSSSTSKLEIQPESM